MSNNQGPLSKALGILEKVLNFLSGGILVILVVIVFSNVLGRYVFHSSLAWAEEISRFMLIWMVFLGSIAAYVNNEHLGLDILTNAMPKRLAQIVAVVADLLVVYALYLLVSGGYTMTKESWDWLSPATAIPYGWVYLIVPFAGSIMIIQALAKAVQHVKLIFQTNN